MQEGGPPSLEEEWNSLQSLQCFATNNTSIMCHAFVVSEKTLLSRNNAPTSPAAPRGRVVALRGPRPSASVATRSVASRASCTAQTPRSSRGPSCRRTPSSGRQPAPSPATITVIHG